LGTLQLNAAVLPEDAFLKDIIWSVENGTGRAEIDKNGLLTAVANGTVTVKASTRDWSKLSDSYIVTISNQKQIFPITFETAKDSTWTVFSNGSGDPSDVLIINNPVKNTTNSSAKVLQFVVNDDADVFAGIYSDNYVPLVFTADTHAITMLVYKSIISPVGIKVEQSSDGGMDTEIKVSNTKTDQWETLTFNFASCIGYSFSRISIFPDFPDTRTSGTTVYLDRIRYLAGPVGISNNCINNVIVYPNPVENELTVYLTVPNSKIAIYNSLGYKLDEVLVMGTEVRFDVSNYSKGMYIVKINNDKVAKFIK
jgi:hypothetical protein